HRGGRGLTTSPSASLPAVRRCRSSTLTLSNGACYRRCALGGPRMGCRKIRFLGVAISFLVGLPFASQSAAAVLSLVGTRDGATDGLALMSQVVASPDGAHFYVRAENAIGVYARDPMTGVLAFVEVERDGVGGVDGLSDLLDITLSPEGTHVYGAGYG